MKKLRKNNKGFSLVELIVVIAIMAVLIGVLAPQFIGYVSKSRQSTDVQNAQSLATQISVIIAEDDGATTYASAWTEITLTGVQVPVGKVTVGDGKWYYKYDSTNKIVHIAYGDDADGYELYPTVANTTNYPDVD